MMSSDIVPVAKPVAKDENQPTGGRKTTTARPPEQGLKCPRCDSANTKFCYYNNYSLTQPRHFCKTCRRYWTKGGALRNVPIGGGCRKNKKFKSSSRLSSDSKDSASSSEYGGLKFFHGFPPAMDFELGGLSFPGLHNHHHPPTADGGIYTQFSNFGDLSGTSTAVSTSPSCFSLDPSGSSNSLMGFNHPFSSPTTANGAIHQSMRSMNAHTGLASSIESLSSINQDLHWKLQRQRLAMLFGGDSQKEINSVSTTQFENQTQRPQPILFQNLDISRPDQISSLGNSRSTKEGPSGDTATEWFFGNTFAPATPMTTAANSNGNDGVNDNASHWNGAVQGWGDHLHQPFGTLP